MSGAEQQFDLLITTDRNLRYQQNLAGRRLAILVLPTTSWIRIQRHSDDVAHEVESIGPGEYRELAWRD